MKHLKTLVVASSLALAGISSFAQGAAMPDSAPEAPAATAPGKHHDMKAHATHKVAKGHESHKTHKPAHESAHESAHKSTHGSSHKATDKPAEKG